MDFFLRIDISGSKVTKLFLFIFQMWLQDIIFDNCLGKQETWLGRDCPFDQSSKTYASVSMCFASHHVSVPLSSLFLLISNKWLIHKFHVSIHWL